MSAKVFICHVKNHVARPVWRDDACVGWECLRCGDRGEKLHMTVRWLIQYGWRA